MENYNRNKRNQITQNLAEIARNPQGNLHMTQIERRRIRTKLPEYGKWKRIREANKNALYDAVEKSSNLHVA